MSIYVLWAKKSKEGNYLLPLPIHLADVAETAKKLWRDRLSSGIRRMISGSIGADNRRLADGGEPMTAKGTLHITRCPLCL